jgi:hypothetical protein
MFTKTTIATVLLLTRAAFGAPAPDMTKREVCTLGDDSTCPAGQTCTLKPAYELPSIIITECTPAVQKREVCTLGDDSTCPAGQTCTLKPAYEMPSIIITECSPAVQKREIEERASTCFMGNDSDCPAGQMCVMDQTVSIVTGKCVDAPRKRDA